MLMLRSCYFMLCSCYFMLCSSYVILFSYYFMLLSCYFYDICWSFMALSFFLPPSTFCGPNVVRQLLSRVGPLGLHRCYVQFYVFRCLTFVVVELSKTVRLTFIISLSSCFMWFSLVCYLGRLLVLSDIPATPATRPVTNTRPHLRPHLKHTYDTIQHPPRAHLGPSLRHPLVGWTSNRRWHDFVVLFFCWLRLMWYCCWCFLLVASVCFCCRRSNNVRQLLSSGCAPIT